MSLSDLIPEVKCADCGSFEPATDMIQGPSDDWVCADEVACDKRYRSARRVREATERKCSNCGLTEAAATLVKGALSNVYVCLDLMACNKRQADARRQAERSAQIMAETRPALKPSTRWAIEVRSDEGGTFLLSFDEGDDVQAVTRWLKRHHDLCLICDDCGHCHHATHPAPNCEAENVPGF